MNSKKFLQGIALVFVLMIGLSGLLAIASPSVLADTTPTENQNNDLRTISVSGSSVVSVEPNQVEVSFSIETDNVKALKSQQDNAELSAKVKKALLEIGVKEEEIKTTSYSLNEQFEWDSVLRKSKKIGYRTTHSMKVTVKDTEMAGKIVDAVIQGGATRVSNISFTIDSETREKLTLQALELASEKTLEKAKTIAKGIGVTVKQLESATEGNNYYVPVRNYYPMEAKAEYTDASPVAPTEFSVGNIEINATVSAVYSIE